MNTQDNKVHKRRAFKMLLKVGAAAWAETKLAGPVPLLGAIL